MLTLGISYLQFKCAHLFESIFKIIPSQAQCFSTRRLWIKQRSSLASLTVLTKLQFVRIKTKRVYINRRRTTSIHENGKNANIMHRTKKSRRSKNCHFLVHPLYVQHGPTFVRLRMLRLFFLLFFPTAFFIAADRALLSSPYISRAISLRGSTINSLRLAYDNSS